MSVIVMACNEHESGKPKCELYWPQQLETSQQYGNIQVTLMRTRQICSDFLVRKFSVKLLQPVEIPASDQPYKAYSTLASEDSIINKGNSNNNTSNNNNDDGQSDFVNNNIQADPELVKTNSHENTLNPEKDINLKSMDRFSVVYERTICQFHYTTWPDHGAPDSIQPILELVRLMREVQPTEDRPILVHCSAGCGRTGTICCIDYVWGLLRRGKLDSSFDLCSIISEMRQQRMAMVQTLEQYILCHRAVAALFMRQLDLIDNHTYENVEPIDDEDTTFDDQDLEGPVFI